MENNHIPSFYIFQPDGSKHPDIIQAFLIKRNLTVEDVLKGEVTLEGQPGKVWKLFLDKQATATFKKRAEAFCLISYQQKKQGYFAVARVFNAKQKANHNASQQEHV